MTVGAWDPAQTEPAAEFTPDPEVLATFIALSEQQRLKDLNAELSSDLRARQAALMRLPKQCWLEVADAFTDAQLVHLVRFFTIAEMQLSGWEAGDKSPVIGLVKALRLRQSPPDKDLLLWIKAHSNNRFLPNGAL